MNITNVKVNKQKNEQMKMEIWRCIELKPKENSCKEVILNHFGVKNISFQKILR